MALLGLLSLVAGCSDDSGEQEIVVIDIEGDWELEATLDQVEGDMTCQIADLTLRIQMEGNTQLFGGSTSGGELSCTGGEAPVERGLPVFEIGTATQDKGSEVGFNLSEGGTFQQDQTFLEFDGSLSGVRMEGQVQGFIRFEELGRAPAFQGTFVNRRTSE